MISEWQAVLGQSYHGGAPPTLSNIVDEKDKVRLFVKNWLGHRIYVNQPLQYFL